MIGAQIFKSFLFLWVSFTCWATANDSRKPTNSHSYSFASLEKDKPDSDVVRVVLTSEIFFNWNNASYRIVEDSSFFLARKMLREQEDIIVECIADTGSSDAFACSKIGKLPIGDLSYLFIEKSYELPRVSLLGQFDVFEYCIYPVGFFDYLDTSRTTVKDKVKNYLRSQAPSRQ